MGFYKEIAIKTPLCFHQTLLQQNTSDSFLNPQLYLPLHYPLPLMPLLQTDNPLPFRRCRSMKLKKFL